MRLSQLLLRGALCLAAFTTIVNAQSVAILTGSQGTGTSIPVYSGNPLVSVATTSGVPAGAFLLLPKPDGSKYYLLTNSTGITVLDRNLRNPVQILTSLNAAPTKAVISPDGRRMIVIAGGVAYIIDTATDTIVGGALNLSGTPVDVAFSVDSLTAYILSNQATQFAAFVTPIDLVNNVALSNLQLPITGSANGITTGPNGLLYVTAPNALFEINPRTMLISPGLNASNPATIPVNGTPDKVQFLSDGQTAVALNRTPASGAAIIFNIGTRTATLASGANLNGTLDQLLVASDGRIFVHSNQNSLYELSLGGGFTPSPINAALASGTLVQSILPSGEAQAKNLFVIGTAAGTTTVYRFDIPSNNLITQATIPNQPGQVLALIGTNPTSGGTSIQGIGTNQNVAAGGYTLPLVARVLDANGMPVFNATVAFTVLAGGVTLSSPSANTNANGYAQVLAIAGANPGSYQVQASVPGAPGSASYTIVVTGGGVTPGCTQNCNTSGIFVVSGNGQLLSEQQFAQQLLLVVVKDANGNPLIGQQVTFTITQGSGTLACTGVGDQFPYIPSGTCIPNVSASTGLSTGLTVVTDNTGQAGAKFIATSTFGQSYVQNIVNAAAPSGSVNFTLTTILGTRTNGTQASPPIFIVTLPPGLPTDSAGAPAFSGTAGQTIPGAIKVQVIATEGLQAGTGIPGVAINVSGISDPRTTASATCAGGSPITDSTGSATCDLVLGPVVGTNALSINIGSAIQAANRVDVVVSQAVPSKVTITQGNNQSGNAGQQVTLRAQISNTNGQAVPNVPVTWTVAQGSATLGASSQQSDSQGFVQSSVTLGPNAGPVTVRLSAGSGLTATVINFNLTVNNPVTVGGVTATAGTGQTTFVGQPFGAPLTVQVTDNNGRPLAGVPVTFAVVSGSAVLGATSVVSDAQGNATTTISAGANAGSISVTASAGNSAAQFTLTSRVPGPNVTVANFRNAASNQPGLTPCGLAILSGAGLAPGIQGTVTANNFTGPYPYTLAGDSITVNGLQAPIVWVSNTVQGGEAIAFQTPCEVTPGPATVVVTVNSGTTTVINVPVAKYQPGIFDSLFNGRRFAVLVHAADGSYVTPDNPARRGEQLEMFVTGLGLGTPATATNRSGVGQPSDALITVGVNNAPVRVIGSQYLPGEIGIYMITFEVPSDTAPGPYQNLGLIVSDPNDPAGTSIYAFGSFLPIA